MRIRTQLGRLLGAGVVVAGIAGVGTTLLAAPAEAATSQASNFNVTVMSPGQDEGTLSSYSQCGTSNPHNSPGYWSFPSKQSSIDNGLQTDIGNDQGMLKLTFNLPSSVNSGVVNVSAPNPPRPSTVPGSAPYGTVFPADTGVVNPGASSLYGCTVPAGQVYSTYYYAVSITSGSSTYFILPGSVEQSSTATNQVGIPFSFPAGTSSSSVTVYVADVVNPPEGTYNGVGYTVGVQGSTALPAPAQNSTTFVATTPDPQTSQLTSSLTAANPTLTATNIPSEGAVLTATIYDAFFNPVAGESIYIGVNGGPGGAETAPIGSSSTSGGNGEPQTGSNGEAQYYAYGTEATPPGNPDTFFAQDTTSGIFIDQPPPAAPGTLATIAIPIVAADPNPPSVAGSASSVSVTGGTAVSPLEAQVTADGTSSATITITLADQFGNAATNQAIILQPIQPAPPAPSENFKKVVINPVDPPSPGDACSQGPSSQIPGISCTDGTGTTQFTVTDTLAQRVSFEITDLTDGYVLPDLYFPTDVPNIPIVDFQPGLTSPSASTVNVEGGEPATVLADGSAAATIDVTLLDAEGNAEVGKQVSLAGSAGTSSTITAVTPAAEVSTLDAQGCAIPAPGVTDCDGNAYFTVSDSHVETVTYTATDNTDLLSLTAPSQQPVVSFVTGSVSADNSTVSVSPPTVVGDGQGVARVTVTVYDQGNHALDGETVTLGTSAWPSITSVPQSATTNAAGVATFQVRSSSPIGSVSLPVTVGATALTASADITFTQPPDPANTSVVSSPPSPQATGSANTTVTVTVADATDTGIAGLSVELLGGSIPGSPPTATTDGSGVATFSVGATLPGPVTYTAVDLSDNDRTLGTALVTYVPVPDEAHESTVVASPSATYTFVAGQPASAQSATVTVTLKDAAGAPISGDSVDLAPSSANAGVTPVAGGVSDPSGVATFTVTDPVPEQVSFTATDVTTNTKLVQTAQVSFVLRPDEDTTSTISALSPAPPLPPIVVADGTSSATLLVTLVNNGLPLAGDTVSLSQGQGSSIITTSDPVSNALGQVEFTVTDLTAQSVAYQATDLTTATELTHDFVVTFTAPPGGSLQPVVTAIDPTTGPGTGGTEVTVTGSNFASATGVEFGTEPAPTFTISSTGTEIVALSPIPVAAGSVNVTVSGPGGTSPAVAGDVFTYTSAPPVAVAAVTPSSGPVAGGTRVTLTGTGLAGASSVRFGSLSAQFVLGKNGTSLTAVAPAATDAKRVDVVVTAGGDTSHTSAMDVFAFVGPPRSTPPAITSLSPSSGPVSGGSRVTVRGSNLSHATKVDFGGRSGSVLFVNDSGTSLTVRAPAAERPGVVRVTVVTRTGTSASVAADRFSYVADPTGYHKLARPAEVLDTSAKGGGGPLGAGATRTLRLAGVDGVPADATEVVVRATITARAGATSVTLFPAGAKRPATGSVTARAGQRVTGLVKVTLGRRGAIAIYNRDGSTEVVLSVIGYYLPVAPGAGATSRAARRGTSSPRQLRAAAELPLAYRSASTHRSLEGAPRS